MNQEAAAALGRLDCFRRKTAFVLVAATGGEDEEQDWRRKRVARSWGRKGQLRGKGLAGWQTGHGRPQDREARSADSDLHQLETN